MVKDMNHRTDYENTKRRIRGLCWTVTGLLPLCVQVAVLSGCAPDTGSDGLVPILLTTSLMTVDEVSVVQGATRGSADAESDCLPSTESFYVRFTGGATTVSEATYRSDGNGGSVLTSGEAPYFTMDGKATTLYAYHGTDAATGLQVTGTASSFSVSADQSGDEAYLASDLLYATTTLTKHGTTAVAGLLAFKHRMAKIVVNATPGAGVGHIRMVRIVGGYRTVNLSDGQTCELGTSLSDALTTASYLTMFSGSSSVEVSCAAVLPPQMVSSTFLQVVTDAGTATYSLLDKQLDSGWVYTIDLSVNAIAINSGTVTLTDWTEGLNVSVVNSGGGQAILNNYESVDIGLGLLWAKTNIGAMTETDPGAYFAWGEVESRYDYKEGNYRYAPHDAPSAYNATDGWVTLKEEHDVAAMTLGNGWRMPTRDEYAALVATQNNAAYQWTWYPASPGYDGSGRAGWEVVYMPTGAHLFFPAGGQFMGAGLSFDNRYGLYWSSTVSGSGGLAWRFRWIADDGTKPSMEAHWRWRGYSIRAVKDMD